ncbi:TRAP transporter small permease [Yoonia sp. MH D7]
MVKRILDLICNVFRVLLACLVAALTIPVTMQVIARYTGIIPGYLWTEELAGFIFVWVVMIGSMVAVWDGEHFDVRVIPDAQSPLLRLLQSGLVHVLILGFGLIFFWYGLEYAEFGTIQNSMMMRANMLVTFISVPIAGAFWALFSGYRFYEDFVVYQSARSALR